MNMWNAALMAVVLFITAEIWFYQIPAKDDGRQSAGEVLLACISKLAELMVLAILIAWTVSTTTQRPDAEQTDVACAPTGVEAQHGNDRMREYECHANGNVWRQWYKVDGPATEFWVPETPRRLPSA